MKISFSAALTSLEERLITLNLRYKRCASSENEKATLEYEISMALQSLVKIQDQIMNDINQKFGTPPFSDKSPYFPAVDSKEKLDAALIRAKIFDLHIKSPELYELILKSMDWVTPLRHLANDIHRNFAQISERGEDGVGFGRGQNLYINGVMNHPMDLINITKAWNQQTGKPEPLRVDVTKFERILSTTGEDPIGFCMDHLRKVRVLIQNISKHT